MGLMSYYVKATGANRFAGGTPRWLKILEVSKAQGDAYLIKIRINGSVMYVFANRKGNKNLTFAKGWPGLMPVSFNNVLSNMKVKEIHNKKRVYALIDKSNS